MKDTIKHKKFDQKLNELQKFSEKLIEPYISNNVDEDGGLFYLFDHKVTGKELNKALDGIDHNFITTFKQIEDIVREFKIVYETFDNLDKEYIYSILIAQKSAEESSNQALASAKKAEKNTKNLRLLVNKLQEKRNVLGIEGNLDAINKKLARRINLLTVLSILSITLSIGLSIFVFLK